MCKFDEVQTKVKSMLYFFKYRFKFPEEDFTVDTLGMIIFSKA